MVTNDLINLIETDNYRDDAFKMYKLLAAKVEDESGILIGRAPQDMFKALNIKYVYKILEMLKKLPDFDTAYKSCKVLFERDIRCLSANNLKMHEYRKRAEDTLLWCANYLAMMHTMVKAADLDSDIVDRYFYSDWIINKDLDVASNCLFVYEIDGKNEFFIMGRNSKGKYVSFDYLGRNLDVLSVRNTMCSLCKSYTYSEKYEDLQKALSGFNYEFSGSVDINLSRFDNIRDQLRDVRKLLRIIKSPEQKIQEKMLREREARNERIRKARENINIYEPGCAHTTMQAVIEAFIESRLNN